VRPFDQAQWLGVGALTSSWPSALCRPWHPYYIGPGDGTPAIFTACQCWRSACGVPQVDAAPVVGTQPGGDAVAVSTTPGHSPAGPNLAAHIWLTWSRVGAYGSGPFFLAVSARSALNFPEGEDLRTKDKWGGVLPIVVGVPVCIDELLQETGRLLLGAVIVMHVDVGEVGCVPFFAGQVCVRNVEAGPPPIVGWGSGPWGSDVWGD